MRDAVRNTGEVVAMLAGCLKLISTMQATATRQKKISLLSKESDSLGIWTFISKYVLVETKSPS